MKKLLHFLLVTTIIAAIAAAVLFELYYYRIHLIVQPLTKLSDFDNELDYSIVSVSSQPGAWNETTAYIYIDVVNNGSSALNDYCDVSLTLVDSSNNNRPIMIGVDTDTSSWAAGETTSIVVPIDVREIGHSHFSMYFKVWDNKNACDLVFNNNLRSDKNGYYLGTMSVSRFIDF